MDIGELRFVCVNPAQTLVAGWWITKENPDDARCLATAATATGCSRDFKRGISAQRSEPLRNLLLRDAFLLSDIAQNALSKHVDLVDQKLSAVRPLRFRKLAMSGSTD